MIRDVFFDQKRVNVCEHMVKAAPRLYHVFTYIYSLLIKKDISDHQNVLFKLLCVYVCLSSRGFFIFSVRVFSFFTYFCVIRTLVLYFPCDLCSIVIQYKLQCKCCCPSMRKSLFRKCQVILYLWLKMKTDMFSA